MKNRCERKKILKFSVLRVIVVSVLMLTVIVGVIFHTGWGSLSAFGVGDLFLLCPLGGFEAILSSRSIAVHAIVAILVVCVLVLVVGKAFCAWVCPVSYLSRFLSGKKGSEAARQEQLSCSKQALAAFKDMCSGTSDEPASACGFQNCQKKKIDSRHFVLVGALASALIFGFPVFCLVCPIGLTVGTIVAFVQLIGFNQPSIGLVLFPLVMVVELAIFRKWCHTLCPIGALLSLISSFNRTFRPVVDKSKCLRYVKGELCAACSSACSEFIDPHSDLGVRPISECTRCGKCVEACPQKAMRFEFMAGDKHCEVKNSLER